jgi:hypothetical protein
MKYAISPEEYKKRLNVIKALKYIIDFHISNGEYHEVEKYSKELAKNSTYLSNVYIKDDEYLWA